MPVNVKRLTIENKTFSLNALIVNPDAYLQLMRPLVSQTAFVQKVNENTEKYVTRLFNSIYNRMNPSARTGVSVTTNRQSIALDESCDKILNSLGIDVVKKCPKRSSVMFKNSGNRYRISNEQVIALADAVKRNTKYLRDRNVTNKSVNIGVELEFVGLKNKVNYFCQAMEQLVGSNRFLNYGSYNKNDGKKWILGKDCSVKPRGSQRGRGLSGFELTSPILNIGNQKDFTELQRVLDLIKEVFGGEVNSSCGTHIHMSFPVEKATDELVLHFARSYRKSERSLFDKVVPNNRRENHAHYSRSVSVSHVWSRYQKLNFNNVKKDAQSMHLEFRQLNGTLDYNTIYSWIKLQKLFVELTMKSYKKTHCEDVEKPVKLELEGIIIGNMLDKTATEGLMKMSRMVA